MGRYVFGLDEIDETQVALVGGKAANLGALSRIDGISVPRGFCVTTDAFRRAVAGAPLIDELLHVRPAEELDGRQTQRACAEVADLIE